MNSLKAKREVLMSVIMSKSIRLILSSNFKPTEPTSFKYFRKKNFQQICEKRIIKQDNMLGFVLIIIKSLLKILSFFLEVYLMIIFIILEL